MLSFSISVFGSKAAVARFIASIRLTTVLIHDKAAHSSGCDSRAKYGVWPLYRSNVCTANDSYTRVYSFGQPFEQIRSPRPPCLVTPSMVYSMALGGTKALLGTT